MNAMSTNSVEDVRILLQKKVNIMKSREEMLQEMMQNIQNSDNIHLTEVAMPGVKPSQVNKDEVSK